MSDDAVYKLTTLGRALLLIFVALSTILYASSILIVSALLPQMQGTLGATQDEVSWAMTFNIVATAVVRFSPHRRSCAARQQHWKS